MKLILMLAYKEKVILTADQMENLKSSAEQLGMKATGLHEESVDPDIKLDVKPGKILDAIPKPTSSLPTLVARPPAGQMPPQRRSLAPAGSPHQRRLIQNNTNAREYESEESEEESDDYQFQLQGYDQHVRGNFTSKF